jgi:RNA 3'-terminal phosphate cyclase
LRKGKYHVSKYKSHCFALDAPAGIHSGVQLPFILSRTNDDQRIPFCALADGWSSYLIPKLTDHIETRLWLVEKMLGAKTQVEGNRIRIKEIGYRR